MTVTPMVPPVSVHGPGAPAVVPPSSVPLGFLAAGGVGMTAFGVAAWFAADRAVVSPTHPGVVSAVHVGVLAFLSIAVLGALHQFAPVVGRRPLRSVPAARASLVGMLVTAWLLPTGFAHGPEWLIPTAGLVGAATVLLVAWNLSGPLGSRDAGLPGWGMRFSVAYLVITVGFGVVYAFDRQTGWFPLLPHRVLAHAHLGLIGWLGLTYVSVAEKLWPMFLLAHRPKARSGVVAVWAIASGVLMLAPGLLFAVPALAWSGGAIVGIGAIAHLTSLVAYVRHRRRPLELLHAYLFVSAGFLVAAIALGAAAGGASVSTAVRVRLASAEVAALIAWLALAITGHAHKIVPFIGYSVLRARGITEGPGGKPLLFGDLFAKTPARVALGLGAAGFAIVLAGILSGTAMLVALGGGAVAGCGAITTVNLASGPHRVRRAAMRCPDDASILFEGGPR
ncbi:MAG: hypothetical protein ACRDZZ_05850 [Ilumatobacteraceae bacterium]